MLTSSSSDRRAGVGDVAVLPRLEVIVADITTLAVDAVVNAANSSLLGGGGVAGAIHRAAGPELALECRRLGGCNTGQAKITGAYRLPAGHVIHTVGPVWNGGGAGEARLLADCYRNSLAVAAQNDCRSVAFPAISTGRYHYPAFAAAEIAARAVLDAVSVDDAFDRIVFCCFDPTSADRHRRALAALGIAVPGGQP
ncbi:O-acetyl-ADP-ribose deacetylase [Caulobacter sp. KR2-114]|uniref:O-acetyl-ADP-ribose deacetylase n=1 Tax=Caulobacter sp. KR2-114 TaxID=3400912 RepID=UPI003C087CD9